MECYSASFNVGNVEVWESDLYSDKSQVFLEIENSKDEIFEQIDCFSVSVTEEELNSVWNEIVSDIKTYGTYKNRMNEFDFFVLARAVREKFEPRNCEVE